MYWQLEDAKNELMRRQKNPWLVDKINKMLGDNCPIPTGPYGVLARHIASARLEDLEFEKRCRAKGLRPVILEYPQDLFVTNNPSKIRLVRLFIFEGNGRRGGPRIRRVNVVPTERLNNLSGKVRLFEMQTSWGEGLVDFHHRSRQFVGLTAEVIDVSGWLELIGKATEYYRYLLAAFVTCGILFESFESPGFLDLDAFTQNIVLPSLQWVKEEFGYPPLIVYHPEVELPEKEWRVLNWYPPAVLEAIPEEFRRGYL